MASPLAVWPDLTLEECEAEWRRVETLLSIEVADLTVERLAAAVDYVNSKGERYTSRVEDILMHVVLHSAYHRGQIALELRAAGFEPAYTDYIHAVRKGLVE